MMGDRYIPGETVPFSKFGILLPIVMFLLVPGLGVMYIGKHFYLPWLYKAASVGVIAVMVLATALIIVSGIYGAHERAKYRKLSAGINAEAHRRMRGF